MGDGRRDFAQIPRVFADGRSDALGEALLSFFRVFVSGGDPTISFVQIWCPVVGETRTQIARKSNENSSHAQTTGVGESFNRGSIGGSYG